MRSYIQRKRNKQNKRQQQDLIVAMKKLCIAKRIGPTATKEVKQSIFYLR